MDKEALLRLVDSLHRDKDIAKEKVFEGIEAAIVSAAKKHYKVKKDISVKIDRETGDINIEGGGVHIDPSELGRITAQTAKQVIIQKVREAECVAVFDEFVERKGTIISGVVLRFEGANMIVDCGKTEGVLYKSGQIYGEYYHVGERVRSLITDVKRFAHKVKVCLSRTHPDFVRRLFEMEVPEINEEVIEIKGVARESGFRTKIAVYSNDNNVDCVGACVGLRGVRIKSVVDELNGEKIDIVTWSDIPEELLPNALKPADVSGIVLSSENRTASVVVPDEQFSLAIGKRGLNVRLASMLTDWNLDIITESQFEKDGGEDTFGVDSEAGNNNNNNGENDGEVMGSNETSDAEEMENAEVADSVEDVEDKRENKIPDSDDGCVEDGDGEGMENKEISKVADSVEDVEDVEDERENKIPDSDDGCVEDGDGMENDEISKVADSVEDVEDERGNKIPDSDDGCVEDGEGMENNEISKEV